MSTDKKRKRSSAAPADIGMSTAAPLSFPPILATTHGVILPTPLPLHPYSRPSPSSTPKRPRRDEYLLHAATPRVDYEGCEYPEDAEYHKYYIGIFDPATNSVELHVAPKVHFSRTIKAHAERDRLVDGKGVLMSNADSRANLGRQFGTKKAQKALLSRELNRIDVTDMDTSVTTSIIASVGAATLSIPTSAQLGAQLLDARPIPPPNRDAGRPEDVYTLTDVISTAEWNTLWTPREWEEGGGGGGGGGAGAEGEVGAVRSLYVRTRLARLAAARVAAGADGVAQNKQLKMLRYVSHLIDFFLFQARGRGRLPPVERAKKALGVDLVLAEGLYGKFAERTAAAAAAAAEVGLGSAGSERWVVSPAGANKCLYYMAVLCLMVDCWEVDLYEVRVDLGVSMKEVTMAFKEVGCAIRELSKTQCVALKMTKAEAMQHKKAVLKIPLEFPAAPRRKAAQRGR